MTPGNTPPLLYSFRFAHHGRYSSYHHLVDFMLPGCKALVVPTGGWFLRKSPRLSRLWMKANEYRLYSFCLLKNPSCIHYLYPENSLFRGLDWDNHHKVVVTWHQPISYLETLPLAFRKHACSILERATAVIFLSSDSLIDHVNHLTIRQASVIKHGVDADFFHPRPAAATTDALKVVTVGSWLRDQRFWAQTISACMAMDSSIRFEVLCDPGSVSRYVQHLTHEDTRVTFVANLNDEKLRAFYQSADVAFLPLLSGTANNALLECMSSGVPCVVSDLASTREYAGSTALFVDNRSPRSAAETLISLAQSPEIRSRLAAAARAKVEQELAWPIIAKQHFDLYSSM